jgi:hypothetical protein
MYNSCLQLIFAGEIGEVRESRKTRRKSDRTHP